LTASLTIVDLYGAFELNFSENVMAIALQDVKNAIAAHIYI